MNSACLTDHRACQGAEGQEDYEETTRWQGIFVELLV
jgi:hypothetical protein